MPDHNTALRDFLGQYGRLCTLVAFALSSEVDGAYVPNPDADVDEVIEAALGRGTSIHTVCRQLRWQRTKLDKAHARCQDACVSVGDFVEAASVVHRVVGEEWGMKLPTFARAA